MLQYERHCYTMARISSIEIYSVPCVETCGEWWQLRVGTWQWLINRTEAPRCRLQCQMTFPWVFRVKHQQRRRLCDSYRPAVCLFVFKTTRQIVVGVVSNFKRYLAWKTSMMWITMQWKTFGSLSFVTDWRTELTQLIPRFALLLAIRYVIKITANFKLTV